MQSTLTGEERRFMVQLFRQLEPPKSYSKDELRAMAKALIAKGMLDGIKPWSFTNRAVCHLTVECDVPYLDIAAAFPAAFKGQAEEISRVRKKLQDDNPTNVWYFHSCKQFIEWDNFDEKGDWRHLLTEMPQEQQARWFIELVQKLVNDGRIPMEKIFAVHGLPEELVKRLPVGDKQHLGEILQYFRAHM